MKKAIEILKTFGLIILVVIGIIAIAIIAYEDFAYTQGKREFYKDYYYEKHGR